MRMNNPIVGKEYDKLCTAMTQCAEHGKLPQVLEIKDSSKVTLKDVHELLQEFTKDTGLHMTFQAETCLYCDRLHAYLSIDYFEDDAEEEPPYPVQ